MNRYSCLGAVALLCGHALTQMSTLPAAKAISEFPGPPPNPPIFSEMTAIMQGGLQFENGIEDLKGNVARIEREDSQTVEANPHPAHTKSVFSFDEQGRLVKSVHEESLGTSTTTNLWSSRGQLESQTVEHHRNDGKLPDWQEWQKWSYDDHGRLSEFKAGRDKEQMNWFASFKYDEQGRCLGYENQAVSLVEVSYSARKVTLTKLRKYESAKIL